MKNNDLQELKAKIHDLKRIALDLKILGSSIPAVERNTSRILASIKMLELNIIDLP